MSAILRPSRPAWVAAVFMLVVGVLLFVYTLIGMTTDLQRSAWELMFSNPTGGSTLFGALLFCSIPVLLQLAVAFSLDRRPASVRIAGGITAFVIAAICLVFLVLALAMAAQWVIGGMPTSGTMPAGGDFQDLQAIALFVPVAIVVAYLDGRAVLLTVRGLRSTSAPRGELTMRRRPG